MKQLATTTLFSLAIAVPAFAASIDIGGPHGNAQGCEFAKDPGNFSGGDYMLLTPEEWKTPESACIFTDASAPWEKFGNRIFTVTAVCSGEGTDVSRTELLRIERDPEAEQTYRVFDAAGAEIGKADRCP